MMEIEIVLEHAGRTSQLALEIDEAASANELYELVAKRESRPPESFWLRRVDVGDQIRPVQQIGDLRLLRGERVKVESGTPPPPSPIERAVEVTVSGGPHDGDVHLIKSGRFEIGRKAASSGVGLPRDESASALHAEVQLTASGIELTDRNSTNGTFVDGVRLEGSVTLKPGQVVQIGDSLLTMSVRAGLHEAAHLRYESGRLLFNRPARIQRRRPNDVLDVPRPPDSPPPRKLPKAMIIGPALLGLPSYLVTKNPLALVMILGSPALALFSWLDDRSSGRKEFAQKAAEYERATAELAAAADVANQRSSAWRAERNPTVDTLVSRALQRSPELWGRDFNDPDFLELRVGEKDMPSLVGVKFPGDGDVKLREEAVKRIRPNRVDERAPIVIPLGQPPEGSERGSTGDLIDVVCVVGPSRLVDPVIRWLMVQLAAHHSPQDLAIAVTMTSRVDDWSWVRWLPHLEQITNEGESSMMASSDADATQLVKSIAGFATNRTEALRDAYSSTSRFQPHLCLVSELPVRIPDADFNLLLEQLAGANMSTILVAPDRRMLPRQADVIITLEEDGLVSVEFVRADVEVLDAAVDGLSAEQAERVARSLAPLKDNSTAARSGASIPNRINLLEMLEMTPLTVDHVLRRWASPPKGVTAPVGKDSSGILSLELSPHGLVGGTTGAGKSEFLQTYVASLALSYPPERLNFVFVDFKGGLAFNECTALPHAVGLITNLDTHLAERVMRSLEAELETRTRIINELRAEAARRSMDVGADLPSVAAVFPDRTPPELVIVFDEFKEAVEKVPARPGEPTFIDRVMSLARLGRQVGMHVILATQTPEGVVTEDLKNNIDLRVALRVKTTDASRSIIGRPDAALIAKRLPGRGFAQIEATDTREFQAAYVGGVSAEPSAQQRQAALKTATFGTAEQRRQAIAAPASGEKSRALTDLQQVLEMTRRAHVTRGSQVQRRPWHPELPAVIRFGEVAVEYDARSADRSRFVLPIGRSDLPKAQRQDLHTMDFDRFGALLVYGGAGAGKSTLLRSIAVSAATLYSPRDLHLYAIDFSGQSLSPLQSLPHCAAAMTGRELDRVRQAVTVLHMTLAERQQLAEDEGVGSLAELRAKGHRLPYLLLLLDGFAQFFDAFEDRHNDTLFSQVMDIVENGRSFGVFSVLTTNRVTLSSQVNAVVPSRLVMRMNNADDYGNLGLRDVAGLSVFPSGRAFTEAGLELQVGVVIPPELDTTTTMIEIAHEVAAIRDIASKLPSRWGTAAAPQLRSLPRERSMVHLDRPEPGSRAFSIGFDELRVAPVAASFERTPSFLVVGPEQSGKTTVAEVLLRQFLHAWPDGDVAVLTARRSPLAELVRSDQAHFGQSDVFDYLREQRNGMAARVDESPARPLLWVLDDADSLMANDRLREELDPTCLQWRDANIMFVACLGQSAAERTYAPWFRQMQSARHGLILMPADMQKAGELLQEKLPNRNRLELCPGRGFLLTRSGYNLIQVAMPDAG